MSKQESPTRVVTGRVRISYEHLKKPRASQQGGELKYSCTVLLPKSDYATKQKIDAAIMAAIQEGVTGKWQGVRPPQPLLPIHDGDGVRPSDGQPFKSECKGCWVFTASSKDPPQIVDLTMNPIIDATQIYSGMYARVSLNFFPYNAGKLGIGCALNNVQKVEDGEPLAGGTTPEEDFGGGYQAPQVPQYPAAAQYPQYPQYPQPAVPPYAHQAVGAAAQYQQPTAPTYPSFPGNPAFPQQEQPYPQYPQPAAPQYPQPTTPQYPQPGQAPAIDPITGKPAIGPVMGI